VQKTHDAEVDLGARHLCDLESLGVTQAHVPHDEPITAEGEPSDAELPLDLVVDPRHQLSPQAFASPSRLQNQDQGAEGDRHHRRDHTGDPQRNDACPSEAGVFVFLLWTHRAPLHMRRGAGEPKHSREKSVIA